MAMGLSTPSSHFKTSYPYSFWGYLPPRSCRYAFYNPRREYHSYQNTSNPSSSNTNFSSSQFQKRYMEDPMPWTGETAWVGYWEPGVSANQSSSGSSLPQILSNHQTPLGSEYNERTYSDPIYPWVQESIRMRQLKLEVLHGTENFTIESMGSEDRRTYSNNSVYNSSTYTPKSEDMDCERQGQQVCQSQFETSTGEPPFINGGVARRLSPHMVSCSGTMNVPLQHDMMDHIQSIRINGQNLDTAEDDPPYKSETNTGDLIKPKVNLVDHRKNLARIYDDILVVDNVLSAKEVVRLLTTRYRNLVHACDTEVAKIDVKKETPVDHGEIVCFSIYSGSNADFGNGKSCVWVDVLDGGRELLMEFTPFFEDSTIRKVWHNYSFDSHVIGNYGIKLSGFHADTMHMARLWDSSRRNEGGYSLEALTSNKKVMDGAPTSDSDVKKEAQYSINRELVGKISMKTIFGKKRLRGDGSEGKVATVAPVEELQRKERVLWICYSALDSMSTLMLFESLQSKLEKMNWVISGKSEAEGSMYEFYEKYWKPFGELLMKMETEGMLVDRSYLWEIQKIATREQQLAANRFRKWASKYCPDAIHMNVGSDIQLRQLFFGGTVNRMNQNEFLPETRSFRVPNMDMVLENGKNVPSKFRTITLSCLGVKMETDMYTVTGWPSVCGDALKALAGKVSSEYDWIDDTHGFESDVDNSWLDNDVDVSSSRKREKEEDVSSYGTAFKAFGENMDGKEACHAIAALCELRSIDSLISNFILPLQSNHISGKDGRIHCSLNINTETGRLSARRPNLQNQPALEKDRYKIRQAFIAAPGNCLIVADYGQLELRILAHLADCESMKDAFKAGGDFHSRTAMNMYSHIREAVAKQEVLLEWHPHPNEEKPPVPLLKDAFASERRKAKMLNFSIAYGKTPFGLARDWKVSLEEAEATVNLWYQDRKEVLRWQEKRKQEANKYRCVKTLLGRTRFFPSMRGASNSHRRHIERAAINTPVQGSAADVAMCAMLEISRNASLKNLGWRLLLQVHDEVILEGPTESAEVAKALVVECMSKPFDGTNILSVDLAVDAKCAQNWYAAK